jgi:hypothetical protein
MPLPSRPASWSRPVSDFKRVGWHYIDIGTMPSLAINNLRRQTGQKLIQIFPNCGSWVSREAA